MRSYPERMVHAALHGRRTGLALLASGCVAAAVVLYAFALLTAVGRHLDRSALFAEAAGDLGIARESGRLLATISVASIGSVVVLAMAVALLRDRPRAAVAAFVVVAGANVSAQLLKRALGAADPLGGETARRDVGDFLAGAFPSGHATAALSLGLALVLVSPTRLRRPAAAVAVAYGVGVGIATVALGWHFPSDVVGAFLITIAWAAAAALVAGDDDADSGGGVPAIGALLGLAGGLALLAVGARSSLSELPVFLLTNTSFVIAVPGIALAGLALVSALLGIHQRAAHPGL